MLSACATHQQAMVRLQNYIDAHPERPAHILQALRDVRLANGMTPHEVELLWGKPRRVNRASYGTQAVHVQMCTSSRKLFQENVYVYYENGVVDGWQVNDCIY